MKNHWIEISVDTPREYVEPVYHLFYKYSGGKVAILESGGFNPDEKDEVPVVSHVKVMAWLLVGNSTENEIGLIEIGIRLIGHLCDIGHMKQRNVSNEDWMHQEFPPIKIGNRLLITSSNVNEKESDRVIIPLTPGLAFGTGYHPTTRMCLEAIEAEIKSFDKILDVGCGSGILSIAALMLGASHVTCLDVDEDSVKSTRNNMEYAGISGKFEIIKGTLPNKDVPIGKYNITVANISASVVMSMARILVETITDKGVLFVSGILDEKFEDVIVSFEKYGKIADSKRIDDWNLLTIVHS